MIYKVRTTSGQRFTIQADRIQEDGSGVRLYSNEEGLVCFFYSGEVAQIYPEDLEEQATTGEA